MCVEKSSSRRNIFSLAEVNSAYPLMKIPFNKIEQIIFFSSSKLFSLVEKKSAFKIEEFLCFARGFFLNPSI
jgi:hypothetical protein